MPQKIKQSYLIENKKDLDMLARIETGDTLARNKFIEKYNNLFISIANDFAKSYEELDTEDLIQELRIAFDKKIEKYNESRGLFAAYIKRCLVNRAKDYIRQNFKNVNKEIAPFRLPDEDSSLEGIAVSPETQMEKEEKAEELIRLIMLPLNNIERKVLELYLSYYTYKEIASTLNINTTKVDNTMTSAKKKIKQKYPNGLKSDKENK